MEHGRSTGVKLRVEAKMGAEILGTSLGMRRKNDNGAAMIVIYASSTRIFK